MNENFQDWSEWTACEMFGHLYNEDGFCRDCGDHCNCGEPHQPTGE